MDNGEEVRITSATGAQKGSKLARYDLIPAEPLNELAKVYGRGASKYQDRNWERGYDWSLSFAALNRHLWAFWNGEDIDPELGTPHMANVAWHAFVLLEFMNTHPELDNRPNTEHPESKKTEARTVTINVDGGFRPGENWGLRGQQPAHVATQKQLLELMEQAKRA